MAIIPTYNSLQLDRWIKAVARGDIYALDIDTLQLAKLYEASHGGIRDIQVSYYDRESLCILDGNTVVEFDLVNKQYRTLVAHDYIVSAS